MRIKTLSLASFQGIKSLDLDFNGSNASIYGDNATGKTTVANAWNWLIFNQPITGSANFTPKTWGAGEELHNLNHGVEADVLLDDGRVINLGKFYKEIYTKKRGSAQQEFSGHTTDYYIDGVPSKQKDYDALLNGLLGDVKKAQILSRPDYFSEALSWQERRQILLDICGNIADVDVMSSNKELKQLEEYLLKKGTEGQLYTVEEYKKIATAQKTAINKELQAIPARIDEAELAKPDTAGIKEEVIKKEIAKLQVKKQDLEQKKARLQNEDTAMATLLNSIAEVKASIAEARAKHTNQQAETNKESLVQIKKIQQQITEIERQISSISFTIRIAEANVDGAQDKLKIIDRKRKELVASYTEIQAERWTDDTSCPTCGQELPIDQIQAKKEAFNQKKSERLQAINTQGQEEASQTMIDELNSYIVQQEAVVTKNQDDLSGLEKKMMDLRNLELNLQKQLVKLEPFEDTEEYKDLTTRLEHCQQGIASKEKHVDSVTTGYMNKIAELDDEIRSKEADLLKRAQVEQQNKRIETLQEEEKQLSAKYEKLEQGVYLCELFIKTKTSLLDEKINKNFTNVSFRLFQEQVNGGLKETCEVLIPSPEGALVPYGTANNAGRINAGLEIIDVLGKHWGINMPVMVDNAESVTSLNSGTGQIIQLIVSAADRELNLQLNN